MKSTLFVSSFVFPLLFLAGCGGGTTSAQKTTVRVEPYTNPQGQRVQMVYVDWKNTGTTPVRFVVADLSYYDASGKQVGGYGKCVVYSVPQADPGIAAGQSYTEPQGQGEAIEMPGTPSAPVVSAQADIKQVSEYSTTGG